MHLQTCPTRDELSAFLAGKLSEADLETVADHLEACQPCQTSVQSLADVADTLVPQLHGPIPIGTEAEDPELQRLLALVKAEVPLPTGPVDDSYPATKPPPAPGVPLPDDPRQLDHYQLLEMIGQGGMGAVHKALHTRLEKIVALKVLPADRMNNAEAVARFQREMKAVGRLNHPNIVRATDARYVDGVHFLVMEFVEGIDLAKLVKRRGPLLVADACEMVRQAALGLQHTHEHNLVHRDIKPSNLILDREVQVLDLGLSPISVTGSVFLAGELRPIIGSQI